MLMASYKNCALSCWGTPYKTESALAFFHSFDVCQTLNLVVRALSLLLIFAIRVYIAHDQTDGQPATLQAHVLNHCMTFVENTEL